MKPLYIFDLDGTLALITHRRPFVEGPKKDWKAFYKACVGDIPNLPIIMIMETLRKTADIEIYSGRSDEVLAETEEWLVKHTSFTHDELASILFMRPAGDYTPDAVLKKQWLAMMDPDDRARIVAVFEDRSRMVEMWRNEGLTCLQVAPGEF